MCDCRHTTTGREFNVTAGINTRQSDEITKSDMFCKSILQHIGCSKFANYFQDAMGILHKKVVDLAVYIQL